MDIFGESEELDFEADRIENEDEDVLSTEDDEEDALLIDDDEGSVGSADGDEEESRFHPNIHADELGPVGVGGTSTAGRKEPQPPQERNAGVGPLSENATTPAGPGQDNANASRSAPRRPQPEPIPMSADNTSDEDEGEDENILSKLTPAELHSITRTFVVNVHHRQSEQKKTKTENTDAENTPDAGSKSPSASSDLSSESEHGANANGSDNKQEENLEDRDEEQATEAEKSGIDYRSRGFAIRKRALPRHTSPSRSLSPMPSAKKPNPFLDEFEDEPDPTDPRNAPPEVIDVIDEDSSDDDEDVEIIGENWKRGRKQRPGPARAGVGFAPDPRILFGSASVAMYGNGNLLPQNVGFVPRNRHLEVYDEEGLQLSSDEDEDLDPMGNPFGGTRRIARGRGNGNSNSLQALYRTQANAIRARKDSHKPCSLKQKLIAFNNNNGNDNGSGGANGLFDGNAIGNGNGANANAKMRLRAMVEAMSNGIFTEATIPASVRKYWDQRYDLFSRFDRGIRLDEESWYSVTPEKIAVHIAQRCQIEGTIIDAFCGCGGNTIQFANYCKKVVAIDIDPKKIQMAMHNATIYGVEHKIDFVVADFMAIAPVLKADIVFLSPPWGGPGYQAAAEFNLKTMIPMDGIKLFHVAQQITQNIAYFVPKNTNLDQLLELALSTRTGVDIEENFLRDRVKTITAYFGDLADKARVREIIQKTGPGTCGTGHERRIPGGPTQLRHAKEGSPELTTMIF